MTSTLTSWLIFFLAIGPTIVAVLTQVLSYRERAKWMRIFSEKQGIPTVIMETGKAEEKVVPVPDVRKRISVPIPGGQAFRKPQ